jgi:hypothetical protein
MNTHQAKSLIRRIPEELYNQWNLDLAHELFAPDYRIYRSNRQRLPAKRIA